jgi:hypothetical protein
VPKRSRRDVAEVIELMGALANMPRNGGNGTGHSTPLTDPSTNVNERIDEVAASLRREAELTSKYEEKIRNNDKSWQRDLDAQKDRATESARGQEAFRIDSKIQDIVAQQTVATQELRNTATTLAKTVSDTAETARKTVEVAAQQQATLIGQVRDSVTEVRNLVTNFIAAGGATKEASTENMTEKRWNQRQASQRNEWQNGVWVTLGIFVAGILLKAFHVI